MSMKKKVLSVAVLGAVLASNIVPTFANPISNEVPVYGKIGIWQDGATTPDGGGGGEGTPDNQITPPTVTDISITVPTAMVFNIVTNSNDGNPVMATTNYEVENNGSTGLDVEAEYNVTNNNGINLVDRGTVSPVKNGTLNLAVGLQDDTNTNIIQNLKDGQTATFSLTAAPSAGVATTTHKKVLKFVADQSDMADIKAEQPQDTKTLESNLTFTFSKQ